MSELNERLRQSLFLLWMNTDGETLSGLYFGREDLVLFPVPQLRKEPGRNREGTLESWFRRRRGTQWEEKMHCEEAHGPTPRLATIRSAAEGFLRQQAAAVETLLSLGRQTHLVITTSSTCFPHVWDSDVFHGCQVTSLILKNKSHCVFILH